MNQQSIKIKLGHIQTTIMPISIQIYCIEVYGQANETQIVKLKVQQNRALKILHNRNFKTPTRQLH